MSVAIDANVLLYASDAESPRQRTALELLERWPPDRAWPTCSGRWQWHTFVSPRIRGNLVSDAHLAALLRQDGVGTIWTTDRDFLRFPDITARDPYDGPIR